MDIVYIFRHSRLVTQNIYDANGNLRYEVLNLDGDESIVSSEDRVTEHAYDQRNLLVATALEYPDLPDEIDSLGLAPELRAMAGQQPVVRYRYDSLGNLAFQSDPRNDPYELEDLFGTKYEYDELGQQTKIIRPTEADSGHGEPTTVFHYDDGGRLTWVQSPGNPATITTRYQYDDLDRLIQKHTPAGAEGNYLTTKYTYDLRDNILEVELFSSAILFGVTVASAPLDIVTTNYYDARDRLYQVDHPDPSQSQQGLVTLYAYNGADELQRELVYAGHSPHAVYVPRRRG